jgi:hypothetical protein
VTGCDLNIFACRGCVFILYIHGYGSGLALDSNDFEVFDSRDEAGYGDFGIPGITGTTGTKVCLGSLH